MVSPCTGYAKSAVGVPDHPLRWFVDVRAEVSSTTVKPYKVDDQLVNQELELKHGESTKRFPMDKISNGRFEQVRVTLGAHLIIAIACLAERV